MLEIKWFGWEERRIYYNFEARPFKMLSAHVANSIVGAPYGFHMHNWTSCSLCLQVLQGTTLVLQVISCLKMIRLGLSTHLNTIANDQTDRENKTKQKACLPFHL